MTNAMHDRGKNIPPPNEVFKTKYSNTATECLAVKMIESKLGRSLFLRFDSFSHEVCFGLAYFYL